MCCRLNAKRTEPGIPQSIRAQTGLVSLGHDTVTSNEEAPHYDEDLLMHTGPSGDAGRFACELITHTRTIFCIFSPLYGILGP